MRDQSTAVLVWPGSHPQMSLVSCPARSLALQQGFIELSLLARWALGREKPAKKNLKTICNHRRRNLVMMMEGCRWQHGCLWNRWLHPGLALRLPLLKWGWDMVHINVYAELMEERMHGVVWVIAVNFNRSCPDEQYLIMCVRVCAFVCVCEFVCVCV